MRKRGVRHTPTLALGTESHSGDNRSSPQLPLSNTSRCVSSTSRGVCLAGHATPIVYHKGQLQSISPIKKEQEQLVKESASYTLSLILANY
eukprot:5781893-Amphidinium_carterae.3